MQASHADLRHRLEDRLAGLHCDVSHRTYCRLYVANAAPDQHAWSSRRPEAAGGTCCVLGASLSVLAQGARHGDETMAILQEVGHVARERTEKATSRRRQQATDEGQFAYSQEVTSALTLVVCLAPWSITSPVSRRLSRVSSKASSDGGYGRIRDADVAALDSPVRNVLSDVVCARSSLRPSLPALVGNFLQGLPIFASETVGLKWDRLNPIQGLSRLKTKISPAGVGARSCSWSSLPASFLEHLSGSTGRRSSHSPAHSIESSNCHSSRRLSFRIVTYIGIACRNFGVADFFLQRWRFEKSIKQTKAEVKEDMKALEGNPQIKGKIRSIQRERRRRRMMSRVKDADVIVTNPTHYAVALEYKPESMAAPRVVAKGQRLACAENQGSWVGNMTSPPSKTCLWHVLCIAVWRSNRRFPTELYKAVAEVLAFVYKIRKRVIDGSIAEMGFAAHIGIRRDLHNRVCVHRIVTDSAYGCRMRHITYRSRSSSS